MRNRLTVTLAIEDGFVVGGMVRHASRRGSVTPADYRTFRRIMALVGTMKPASRRKGNVKR